MNVDSGPIVIAKMLVLNLSLEILTNIIKPNQTKIIKGNNENLHKLK